jgi:O-antigen ligase
LFVAACALLVFSQTECNGPDGAPSAIVPNTLLQLFSIAIVCWCLFRKGQAPGETLDPPLRWSLIGVAGFALIQLFPLPPAIWTWFGGRAELVSEWASAGIQAGWHSISLSPLATQRSLLTLLPAFAMYALARVLPAKYRRNLVMLTVGLGVAAGLLGVAQIADGPDSVFRLYRPANTADAVGFFANRNHLAGLLAMLLPFPVAWMVRNYLDRRRDDRYRIMRWVVAVYAVFLLIVAILLTHSRAGVLLILLNAAGGVALIVAAGIEIRTILAIAGACSVAVVMAMQIAGSDVLSRLLMLDMASDTRWPIQATTLHAVRHFGIWGSGLGTFLNAYQAVAPDVQPDQDAYVNHANNDYLELWLEGGWPALVLIAAFLGWFGWAAMKVWRRDRPPSQTILMARAASLSIGLALLHALLEYQLRKPGILVVFALCCALLASAAYESEDGAGATLLDADPEKRRRSVPLG